MRRSLVSAFLLVGLLWTTIASADITMTPGGLTVPQGYTLGNRITFSFGDMGSELGVFATLFDSNGNFKSFDNGTPYGTGFSARMNAPEGYQGQSLPFSFLYDGNNNVTVGFGGQSGTILDDYGWGTAGMDIWNYLGGDLGFVQITAGTDVLLQSLVLNGASITNLGSGLNSSEAIQGINVGDSVSFTGSASLGALPTESPAVQQAFGPIMMAASSGGSSWGPFEITFYAASAPAPSTPEPASLLIVGIGVAGLFVGRHRKK